MGLSDRGLGCRGEHAMQSQDIEVLYIKFFPDNGKEGRLATMHVMVTGLASLHKRCLVMENTAKGGIKKT